MNVSDMEDIYDEMYEPTTSTETAPLLHTEQHYSSKIKFKLSLLNFIPRQLCIPSKAAVLILFWTTVVSAVHKAAEETALYIVGTKDFDREVKDNLGILLVYLAFVLVYLLYPFAGFLADVYCGRHRTVIISLCLLLCGNACLCLTSIFIFTGVVNKPYYKMPNAPYYFSTLGVGTLLLVTGLSGYQANIVQLGLDQLLDSPSEYLGLFVHWLELFIEIGFFFPRLFFVPFNDCGDNKAAYYAVLTLPFIFVFLISFFLFFGCWRRRWFYTEPGQRNPYRMVARVLNFTRKNKYPLRRSAFTYCGDEDPSRIDFAKERYGGPFTTEQVEDVKTFLKLLIVLLVICPIFFLEIPLGPLFTSFSDHVSTKKMPTQECSLSTVFHHTVVLRNIMGIAIFLVYIWLIYTVLRRCIPRTLYRIFFGELLFILGAVSLFIIDSTGHAQYYTRNHETAACVFMGNYSNHSAHLGLPWAVNILPAFLLEGAVGIVIITTFEFISAQSPHSMKGLLIGVFYAFRGFFNFLGAMSVLPFSVSAIWSSDYMKTHMPTVTNCGFGYLLLNCVVGFMSVLLFTVVARRYKNRQRNDPPFNQTIVESVWADRLRNS